MRRLTADMHIHTCLSPCATLDMTPVHIVQEALRKKLDIIAITDHNSAENTPAVIAAAKGTGLWVVPGMEITTSEEVHIIGLFPDLASAWSMQEVVYEHLMPGENDPDHFGLQVVANENDEVEAINTLLLIGATTMDLDETVDQIHLHRGLAVAAHLDREAFGILGQLGFIPPDLELDAVEVSRRLSLYQARARFEEYGRFPMVRSSDAHSLEDIGAGVTRFLLARKDIAELVLALKGEKGRRVRDEAEE
mgnify:CR=1 FL=1